MRELQELVIASGLRVLEAMLEEDHAHQPARHAYRAGHAPSQVKSRDPSAPSAARRHGGAAAHGPGVHGRGPALPGSSAWRTVSPLGANITTRGTSKSAVSRLLIWRRPRRSWTRGARHRCALDLAVLLIDGVQVGGHCIVVALHRHNGDQTPARPLGRSHGECDGLSGPVDQSCESRAAHRPEPPGDRRWGEGPRDGGDPDVRPGRRGAAVSSAQGPEHPGASPRGTTSVGEGNPYPRLTSHRQDGETTAAGPGSPLGHRPPECGRERPRRPRRDADRARLGPVGTPPTIARHHERHRVLSRTRHVKRNVKRWRGGTMVLRWVAAARSREGVPPGQRMSRYAGARRRPPGA